MPTSVIQMTEFQLVQGVRTKAKRTKVKTNTFYLFTLFFFLCNLLNPWNDVHMNDTLSITKLLGESKARDYDMKLKRRDRLMRTTYTSFFHGNLQAASAVKTKCAKAGWPRVTRILCMLCCTLYAIAHSAVFIQNHVFFFFLAYKQLNNASWHWKWEKAVKPLTILYFAHGHEWLFVFVQA